MKIVKNCIKPYRGLPGSIYVIFFASIVNNMGNFVAPFLTMFLTYKVGLKVEMVGIIVAVNSALGMAGAMLGGKFIDKMGRKKILMIFRPAAALGYAICAFVKNPMAITAILMFSSFIGAFSQPVYSTMITDMTQGEQRKAAFSLEYISLNIGFSVGPLLAAFLYNNYLKWLFLGDALTTFISVVLIAAFVPETMPNGEELQKAKADDNESAEEGSLMSALLKRPTLILFSMIIVIYFVVFSQFNFGLSLQVGDIFKDRSSTVFGSLMSINAVMCSTLTVFVTSATKNVKASLSISAGGILYAVGFGMLFFISSYHMFIVSTVLWTIGEILVATNTSVYIASHTPITHRGRFNSVFPIIRKMGFIIGPVLGGICIKHDNIRNLWLIVGALSIVGSLMMYGLYKMDYGKSEEVETQAV